MLRIGLLSNPWVVVGLGVMIVLQALFIYAPFANRFFSSAPYRPGVVGTYCAVWPVHLSDRRIRKVAAPEEEWQVIDRHT
jgi:hypothetical protein